MNERLKRIEQWASDLTAEQMRPLLVELVEFAMDADMVNFPEQAPYWSHTGDALVDGQSPFSKG